MSAAAAGPGQSLRDVAQVARFELLESLRTRRVVTLVLLFVVAGGFSAYGFARYLGQAEDAAASVLQIPTGTRPGGSIERLRSTSVYRDAIKGLTGDSEAVSSLAEMPPLALVFAWLMMTFLPVLVLLTSADAISSEVESGALRYVLLRTGRLEYVLGKLVGHVALVTAVLALSATTFLAVCTVSLIGFVPVETGTAMARGLPSLVVHVLPFFGIAFAGSMLGSTAQAGRMLAIAIAVGLSIFDSLTHAGWLRGGSVLPSLLDAADYLTPAPRGYGMLAPIGATYARAMAICVGTAALYLALGFARFRRRDL